MDHNEQAGKNFAWLSVSQIAARLLGAAFFIFLSFKLKEAGVGEYSFVAAFVPLWFLAVDFGGGNYLFREWTKGNKTNSEIENDFQRLFTLRLILVTVIGVPFLLINYYINHQVLGLLVLFFISMFFATFTSLLDLYYQSQNLYRFLATRQVIEKVAAVVFGVLLLLIRPTVAMVFVSILISQLVSIAYYYVATSPFGIKLVFEKAYAKKLFFKGLPFLFIGVFSSLYSKIDVTMLRYMTDFSSVGYYSAAYKFIDFSYTFVVLFVTSVYPLLSPLWHDSEKKEEFKVFFQKCFRIVFSGGLLLCLILIVGAPWFIQWFFPASFSPAILALRILAIGQVLAFISFLFSTLLIIEGREKIGLGIIIFGAIFNIVLNFFLIPRFSLYGSAWATVIAEAGNLFLLQYYSSWQKPGSFLARVTSLALVDVVMFGCLRFLGLTNNPAAGVLVLLTNILFLFTVKLLEKQDVLMFINPFIAKFKSFRSN